MPPKPPKPAPHDERPARRGERALIVAFLDRRAARCRVLAERAETPEDARLWLFAARRTEDLASAVTAGSYQGSEESRTQDVAAPATSTTTERKA